jgi:hypothetical protein
MVNSHHTLKSQRNIINTQQTGEAVQTPYVIDRTAEVLADLAAWHAENDKSVELPVDAVIEALQELLNMSAEEEARLNQIILDEEAGL